MGVGSGGTTAFQADDLPALNDTTLVTPMLTKPTGVGPLTLRFWNTQTIEDDGAVEITIELASVNTMIDIRNERMQAMLFETNLFPEATIAGSIDLEAITAMSPGAMQSTQVSFDLDIHGASGSYAADVVITRTESGVVASTAKPIVITAGAHGLVAGVEALREVAGLPSISRAVPVSFTVVFEQDY